MKFLFTIFALLALARVAVGQASFAFPLTSLNVAINTAGVAPTTLIPPFQTYGQKTLRYAVEVASSAPVSATITWTSNIITSLTWRNCGSFLANPTAQSNSYCSFMTAQPSSGSISLSNIIGINFVELVTTYQQAGVTVNEIYVVNFFTADPNNNQGTNMLALDSDSLFTSFVTPFTPSQSQYDISYVTSQAGQQLRVPIYLGAQKSVSTIFVQECTSTTCANCNIASVSTRKQITSPSTTLYTPTGFNTFPQTGLYVFPATVGANCVRFINRVNQAGTQNENTITINLNVKNCGAFTSCQTCAAQNECGWCLTQFAGLLGSCQVGVASQALTGQTCLPSNQIFASPRWVYDVSGCITVLKGDPRITGLQGQDFQVHGTPNEYFNLLTAKDLQVNSRFVFLDEAQCDNFTTCFTHAGTYIDEIGFMQGENKIRLVAGAINEAARVFINGKEVKVSSKKHVAGKMTVTFSNSRRVIVKTNHVIMTVSQSDKFFNVDSALLDSQLLDSGSKLNKVKSSYTQDSNVSLHGLIGQTWRNNIYPGSREYEGEVPDYQVADGIWGSDFHFNLYQ